MSTLKGMVALLKKNKVLNRAGENTLACSNFNLNSSLPFELYENEIANHDNSVHNRRYAENIKQFCLTMHFYSPKAYEFLRLRSTLPDPSTIRRWLATHECKPGILTEVMSYLKKKFPSLPHLKNVALVYDAMSIRSGRFYCQKEDKYYGYCDLGNIVPEDSEEYATEVFMFSIVSLTKKFCLV